MNNVNLKLIFRSLAKYKAFTLINILGLSLGIACSIVIYLFIEFELSFDKFYADSDQIYRVVRVVEHSSGKDTDGATPYPFSKTLRSNYPDFNVTTFFLAESEELFINGNSFKEKNILFVDSVFFNVFNIGWVQGSPESITEHPGNIAISESMAKKYFKDENPVGKTITALSNLNFLVSGVIKDAPLNSTMQYSFVLSIDNLSSGFINFQYENWGSTISGFESYFKLNKNTNVAEFENNLNDLVASVLPEDYSPNPNQRYCLENVGKMHLSPDFLNLPNTYATSPKSLIIYGFIGFLIIGIACINFVNLSIAQGLKRSKEVGMRKVLGAGKSQLRIYFIKEHALLSFLSLLIAAIIVEVCIPYINEFLGQNHELGIYNSTYFIYFCVLFFILINVMTSLYPSLVFSSFEPLKVLKGNKIGGNQNSFSLRNILLVFQFIISIALIVCALVVHKQINYINNKDLGFEYERVASFNLPDRQDNQIKAIREFLNKEPGVKSHGFGLGAPTSGSNMRMSFNVEGDPDNMVRYMNFKPVDTAYIHVFDLKMLAGSWFKQAGDTSLRAIDIIVSENLMKVYGFKSPMDALNKLVNFGGNRGRIVGVVNDFDMYSLRSENEPLAFAEVPYYWFNLYVDIEESRKQIVTERIETFLSDLYPKSFINRSSVKELIHRLYSEENKLGTIITVLSALAIIISSLGLFGLFSFMIVQRINEIGMRKVLGASVIQIVKELVKSYVKMILISSIIAFPISWYLMDQWLNRFAYRTTINVWVFLAALFLIVFIAITTILIQVIKTSRLNPVESLKYE